MYSMNTGINLTYWMENWNIKVGSFSYYNEKWSWTSKSTNRYVLGEGNPSTRVSEMRNFYISKDWIKYCPYQGYFLFYYRGDGFENYKIQSVELRRAIMNTIHQFWDTNGTKTVWKVGDPDYKIENLDLEYLDLTQPYM